MKAVRLKIFLHSEKTKRFLGFLNLYTALNLQALLVSELCIILFGYLAAIFAALFHSPQAFPVYRIQDGPHPLTVWRLPAQRPQNRPVLQVIAIRFDMSIFHVFFYRLLT